MGLKSTIKKCLKGTYKKYVDFRRHQNIIREIEELTRAAGVTPVELTKKEEEEIKAYWGRYGIEPTYQWHRLLYAITGQHDPSFVPNPVFQYMIKPKMNDRTFAAVWSDKAYIDYFLRGVKTVRSVVRNVEGRFLDEEFQLISMEKAAEIMDQYEKLVVKPALDTYSGIGVELMSRPYNLKKIHKTYGKNYVIQIPVKQHPEMGKLNASSVNAVRINTALFDEEVIVFSAFAKVGMPGKFADNQGTDRAFIGITSEGTFCDYAIDHDLHRLNTIASGYEFAGQKVFAYEKICETARKAHRCIPHMGFAFWDICVDADGEPVIIEANLKHPSTLIPQAAGGAFFGDQTERIMEYICAREKKRS